MTIDLEQRRLGRNMHNGRHARVVSRHVLYGAPMDFRALCLQAVPTDARYLVLDLDRTVHLGHNVGELLGWELCALYAYGPEYLARLDEAGRRPRGRFLLDPRRPLGLARYVARGMRLWTRPGLHYLAWGKLAAASGYQRRRAYRAFGPEPVREVQSVPQTALLQQLSSVPLATVRTLTEAVWARHAPDMIFDADDLRWLRARCPNLRVILSSASPHPVLEVAAAALGVDAFVGTEVDAEDGRLSAPVPARPPLLLVPERPHKLTPPSRYRINAGPAKIRYLLERFPDVCDPGVVTVGISDNGYGEDQCWSEFFSHVVDVNSTFPFAPVVAAESPLREVHSALVLTAQERARRAAGEPAWLDPRRGAHVSTAGPRVFEGAALAEALAGVLAAIEAQATRYGARAREVSEARTFAARVTTDVAARLEHAVSAYNAAAEATLGPALEHVRREIAALGSLRRHLAWLEQPLSDVACELAALVQQSRSALDPAPQPG